MMTVNSNMMTVSIKYNSQYADDTLTSYTQQWAARNGDIREAQDKGFVKQYGISLVDWVLMVLNMPLSVPTRQVRQWL